MTSPSTKKIEGNQISKTSMRLQKWERCECGHVQSSHGSDGTYACSKCDCGEFQSQ